VQSADGVNFTSTQTGDCLQGTPVIGTGRLTGNRLTLTVNWSGFTGIKDKKLYVLDYPFVTGGKFREYTLRGNMGPSLLLNSGTYTLHP
jgi:hypothetical protein